MLFMLILFSAAYVKGRNVFRSNGLNASIGAYAFGFEWASLVCFFLATIFFCIAGAAAKKKSSGSKKNKKQGGFFKGRRSASTRSRGSFINGDKEYA